MKSGDPWRWTETFSLLGKLPAPLSEDEELDLINGGAGTETNKKRGVLSRVS